MQKIVKSASATILFVVLTSSIPSTSFGGNYYKWCQGGDYSGKSECSIFTIASKKAISTCTYSYQEKIVNISNRKVTETRVLNETIDCCEKRKNRDWCEMNEASLLCENVCGIR